MISRRRSAISWRTVGLALALQGVIGALFLAMPGAQRILGAVTFAAQGLAAASAEATRFVFGFVGGGPMPFEITPGVSTFIFAFQVLPVILVVGALSALLWHWRVLGWVVALGAWILRKLLGVSSPVGFAAVANAFLGMIEAPLLIKPYLARLTRSELLMVMSVGMSTIAGGTAIIVSTLLQSDDTSFGFLVTATLMNVPGALALAFLIFPDQAKSDPGEDIEVRIDSPYRSTMDALTAGTADGVKIYINVVSLLIVFLALVAIVNGLLGVLPGGLSLQSILGWLMTPVVWLIGIPVQDLHLAGSLLGTKVAVNELVAYSALAENAVNLTEGSYLTLLFALCGFGNFGSLAILIGGLSAMAPDRRDEIIELGFWSLGIAFMTNCLTAAVATALFNLLQ